MTRPSSLAEGSYIPCNVVGQTWFLRFQFFSALQSSSVCFCPSGGFQLSRWEEGLCIARLIVAVADI